MNILGIETSCDETAAAICSNGKILSNVVSSQLIHSEFGGVVPELASREHERLINLVVEESIQRSSIKLENINLISVTNGPGLSGALLTGVCFAKGLGLGLGIPVIPINHLEAHIFSNFLAEPNLSYPFVCLLVSGGHTQLWHIKGYEEYELLGETRDDAAGEAFDKGARILGLGYPGGPEIEKCAENGNPNAVNFPRALTDTNKIEFSFSGLKTSLLYYMDSFESSKECSLSDVASSYQQAIIDSLLNKINLAALKTNVNTITIAGGVAKNQILRDKLKNDFSNYKIIFPDFNYCTDNAAMISFLGEIKLKLGSKSSLDFGIYPNFKFL